MPDLTNRSDEQLSQQKPASITAMNFSKNRASWPYERQHKTYKFYTIGQIACKNELATMQAFRPAMTKPSIEAHSHKATHRTYSVE